MELTMVNGLSSVGFADLDECEILLISAGEFQEGLVHTIEGVIMTGGGFVAGDVIAGLTTTEVLPALLMVGGGAGACIAIVCGVALTAYGIYEMCT